MFRGLWRRSQTKVGSQALVCAGKVGGNACTARALRRTITGTSLLRGGTSSNLGLAGWRLQEWQYFLRGYFQKPLRGSSPLVLLDPALAKGGVRGESPAF